MIRRLRLEYLPMQSARKDAGFYLLACAVAVDEKERYRHRKSDERSHSDRLTGDPNDPSHSHLNRLFTNLTPAEYGQFAGRAPIEKTA